MRPQCFVATNALASDKHLWRCLHTVFPLEGVGLLPRGEHPVIKIIALAPEQVAGFKPEWAEMIGRLHPVQRRLFAHGLPPFSSPLTKSVDAVRVNRVAARLSHGVNPIDARANTRLAGPAG